MSLIPTPHISVEDKSKIAKTVLMPGDPLRAKYIANTFLENVEEFNSVRGMLGFTGTYNGKKISVMGSGMGMPSIGIYSYELFKFYDIDNIVRIGSAGAYTADLDLYDVILVEESYSESSYAINQNPKATSNIMKSNPELNERLVNSAIKLNIPLKKCRIHSSDVFYREPDNDFIKNMSEKHNCAAVEMESFALFHNANATGKKASSILTISDNLVTHKATSSDERQTAFENMMKIALNI